MELNSFNSNSTIAWFDNIYIYIYIWLATLITIQFHRRWKDSDDNMSTAHKNEEWYAAKWMKRWNVKMCLNLIFSSEIFALSISM